VIVFIGDDKFAFWGKIRIIVKNCKYSTGDFLKLLAANMKDIAKLKSKYKMQMFYGIIFSIQINSEEFLEEPVTKG
jgi:hypothetical protein